MRLSTFSLALAALLASAPAFSEEAFYNTDAVRPNSPLKEAGFPDAGQFNPASSEVEVEPREVINYGYPSPPAIVSHQSRSKPYALVAAPTLPPAPGYGVSAARTFVRAPRADRQ